MKNLSYGAFCLALLVLSVTSIGCGGGNSNTASSTISTTQNPMVAQYQITLTTAATGVWVEFGTDTNYGRQTAIAGPVDVSGTLSLLVAGMRPSTVYHLRGHVTWANGQTWVDQDKTFKTGPLPTGLVTPTLTVTTPTPALKPAPGVELFSLVAPPTGSHMLSSFVTDLQGNVIWYYDVGQGSEAFPIRPMSNGHFLVNLASGGGPNPGKAVLQEIDLAGNVIRQVTVDQINQSLQAQGYSFTITPFHHDVIELPNGHWAALAATSKSFTNLPGYPGATSVGGDVVLDIDTNGNVAWAWSTFDHLDVTRHPFGLPDWTHANALVYTPNDGNLLVSLRNQSWVLKIEYENGQGPGTVLWRLGDGGDFVLTDGDATNWFYGQHFPNVVSTNGSQINLAVFDDGNNRPIDTNGDICGTPGFMPCYSRGTLYQLDEDTKVATLEWEYTPPGLYTFWGGSIVQALNNDVEFDLSEPFFSTPFASEIIEATQTSNPSVVWQMVLQGTNAYRGYRVPSLYPGVTWQK